MEKFGFIDWLLVRSNSEKRFWRAVYATIKVKRRPPCFFAISSLKTDLEVSLEAAKKILMEEEDYEERCPDTWKVAKWWCHYFGIKCVLGQ